MPLGQDKSVLVDQLGSMRQVQHLNTPTPRQTSPLLWQGSSQASIAQVSIGDQGRTDGKQQARLDDEQHSTPLCARRQSLEPLHKPHKRQINHLGHTC